MFVPDLMIILYRCGYIAHSDIATLQKWNALCYNNQQVPDAICCTVQLLHNYKFAYTDIFITDHIQISVFCGIV